MRLEVQEASVPGVVDPKGFYQPLRDTFENLPSVMGVSVWEALIVVSQRWIPFPTALLSSIEKTSNRR